MKRKYWSNKEIDKLVELYPTTIGEDLAIMFKCSLGQVYNKAYSLGLKKDKEFMVEYFRKKMDDPNHGGRKHQFKKGNIPKNKGLKQTEYMSQEAIERTKATRFKKGSTPLNTRPIGSTRVDVDGYTLVKITDDRWEPKHRIIWEKTYGEIPEGYNVQFKDRNKSNFNLDNLYLISKRDQMQENTIARYPAELRMAMKRISKINKLINNEK